MNKRFFGVERMRAGAAVGAFVLFEAGWATGGGRGGQDGC